MDLANSNTRVSGRRLGGTEELFWLYDLASPFHFVMAATIDGHVNEAGWRSALRGLQLAHPLMRMRIDPSTRAFVPADADIPTRVVPASETTWQVEMAEELRTPFRVDAAPLVRATLISGAAQQTILLSAHHAVADGISLAFALRDLLLQLGGGDLLPAATPGPQEQGWSIDPLPDFRGPDAERNSVEVMPAVHVESAVLDRKRTTALLGACRRHDTTVQGLLLAALVRAVDSARGDGRSESIRILVPVSTEPPEKRGGSTRVAITVNLIRAIGDIADLWALARNLKSELLPAQEHATINATLLGVAQAIRPGPSVDEVEHVVRSMFTSDGMVTNLGVLPFPANFGELKLRAMWGPAILTDSPGEQVLGALTLDGALHLTLATLDASQRLMPLLLRQLVDLE